MQEQSALPHRYFISHSYQDAQVRQELLNNLPDAMEPFVFPPITVAPERFVSSELIKAILDCEGLIYLQRGFSAKSFWVAFERDYAIRAGKKVFSYDPAVKSITEDTSPPMNLPVFPSFTHEEDDLLRPILRFMRRERFFDLWIDGEDTLFDGTSLQDVLGGAIISRLEAGGYVAAFLSSKSLTSLWVQEEIRMAAKRFPDRVLPVILEPVEIPSILANIHPVQLYGDDERSVTQRIDDLIVRLYWLIYQNTRQNELQ